MVGVDNVTVYVFLYPLTSLHPNAEKVSNQIWCSKNPAEAWTNYMLNRKLPTNSKSCSSPIQKNIALGQKLNIDGTPTLFLQDGKDSLAYQVMPSKSKHYFSQQNNKYPLII
jgi:thiol:disulfide interchange protein DsbC